MTDKTRLLKRMITEGPFPLAYAIRTYMELEKGSLHARTMALIDILETAVRWLAALSMAVYRQDGFFDRTLNDQLVKLFSKNKSTGHWIYIIRNIFKSYIRVKRKFCLMDFFDLYIKSSGKPQKAAKLLDQVLNARNRIIHGGFIDESNIRDKAETFYDEIFTILDLLSDFLLEYYPAFITVEGGLITSYTPLYGASGDFYAIPFEEQTNGFSLEKSQLVLLRRREPAFYLSLQPFCFLIDKKHFTMLSGYERDKKNPDNFKITLKSSNPPEESSLSQQILSENPDIADTVTSIDDALIKFRKTIAEKEIPKNSTSNYFPSIKPEITEALKIFVGRENDQLIIREWAETLEISSFNKRILFIEGELGMGKTSLLVNMTFELDAIFHSVSPLDQRDQSQHIYHALFRAIVEKFKLDQSIFSIAPDDFNVDEYFSKLLKIVSKKIQTDQRRPLVIIVDNLEGFQDGGKKFLEDLTYPLPKKIGLILSGRNCPKFSNLENTRIFKINPFPIESIIDMVKALIPADKIIDSDKLALSLRSITHGNPLFLRMLLQDKELFDNIDEIDKPDDILKLLLERFDGRFDEDAYESFLALLCVTEEPLSIETISDVIDVKMRKVRTYRDSINSYLYHSGRGITLFTPQLAEYLVGMHGFRGIDPKILSKTLRAFRVYLSKSKKEGLIRYRRKFLPSIISKLPTPENEEGLREWLAGPEFQEKIKQAVEDFSPLNDVRLYLKAGGKIDYVLEVFGKLLKSEEEEIVVGTLNVLQFLSEIPLDLLQPEFRNLELRRSKWITNYLTRLRRRSQNQAVLSGENIRLSLINLVAHVPFMLEFNKEDSGIGLLVSDNSAERLSFVRDSHVEFLATTLDEILSLRENGFEYVPFYRLLHSRGLDAVVVNPDLPIQTLADLKGCSIGYETGSISEVWLHQVLVDHSTSVSGIIEKPYLSIENCCRDFSLGKIDAAVFWEPWISTSKGRIVYRSGDLSQVINDVLCVNAESMDQLAVEAMEIANVWSNFRQGINRTDIPVVARYLNITEEELKKELSLIHFNTWEESKALFFEEDIRKGGIIPISGRLMKLKNTSMKIFDIQKSREYIRKLDLLMKKAR